MAKPAAGSWQELAGHPEWWPDVEHSDPRLDIFAHTVEDRYGLPRGVLEAIKNAGERTPAASSGKPTVSRKGAKGLMQFTDATRAKYEHDVNDPFESIDAAGRYMADVVEQYDGDVMAAIADYNGGPKQGKPVQAGGKPPAAETQAYLQRIRDYMRGKYGDAN